MDVTETDGLLKGAECPKWSNEGVRFGVSSEVTVEAQILCLRNLRLGAV